MNELLQGKRVFKQDGSGPQDRYLLIPKGQIHNCYELSHAIGILKGDFLKPVKWINFGKELLPVESFDESEYEYIFYPGDPVVAKQLSKVLNAVVDKEYKYLLSQETLPLEIENELKEIIGYEAYQEGELKPMEVFKYQLNNEEKSMILDPDWSNEQIDQEHTEEFLKKEIVASYTRSSEAGKEMLLKTRDSSEKEYIRDYSWYLYKQEENEPFFYLKDIDEVEDMIPFTTFLKD